MNWQKHVIAISGASGGLGNATLKQLSQENPSLVLMGRNIDTLNKLIKTYSLNEQKTLALELDITSEGQAEKAAHQAIKKFQKVDILLHFVGGWLGGKTILETPPDDIHFMLEQHLWTTLNLIKAFLPGMLKNNWGRIIAISSPFAQHPRAKGAAYAIGKAAQETLLRTLAQEIKDTNVTANVLLAKTIDVEYQRIKSPSPKNSSWTLPEEIFHAIEFLCSEKAKMVNGARIPLYGVD